MLRPLHITCVSVMSLYTCTCTLRKGLWLTHAVPATLFTPGLFDCYTSYPGMLRTTRKGALSTIQYLPSMQCLKYVGFISDT